ncbi:FliI/YscN family ATPase [Desulfofustis limnaeus]|jgi:flagellum-specific ATP synthase|uniref:Flagellum-specific ATP synthase FliI n=1 Tax=Desulfofustis limnaeus TaxID=2740163 RepID=A0ABM7W8R6_9BACT|nr:FliI/YscN family ATPase [Desulfofustis limnaeus]MDX9896492.1 FliI/YscN family ATPase [Desulfofustis sp.]BDD87332.1 flagellum-specific ATP synthase FliI [Desulfofustis limnaeus]
MLLDLEAIKHIDTIKVWGKVTRIVGLVVEGYCPHAAVGSLCEILPLGGGPPVLAEIVGFHDLRALLMPLGDLRGLGPGSLIRRVKDSATVQVGNNLLGRVIDAMEQPHDGLPRPSLTEERPLYAEPPGPMLRKTISDVLDLGIRAINGMITCGTGQRMGIMAGSGIGKSVLLGMMARYAKADINVIALIGERGREVREFIERDLGKEGLSRSVLVVVTSDQSPLLRMRGAFVATAIAEYFCQQGKNVLLMMDSVTRFAMAMREIGLAVGEPPTTKGYTPSVFAMLPKLLERAGKFQGQGSITGLYTVLVDGDDMTEPVADSVRSILDGHIVLSRDLAARNHYPAIDVLNSTSRVMRDITSPRHLELAGRARTIMATHQEAEDLINIGAYVKGSNPNIDFAISKIEAINKFLRQNFDETASFKKTIEELGSILSERKDEDRAPKQNRRVSDKTR